MIRTTRSPGYRAYMLRCWAEHSERAPPLWRFSLEDPHTQERHGFASLATLVAFLETMLIGMEHLEVCSRSEDTDEDLDNIRPSPVRLRPGRESAAGGTAQIRPPRRRRSRSPVR